MVNVLMVFVFVIKAGREQRTGYFMSCPKYRIQNMSEVVVFIITSVILSVAEYFLESFLERGK